MKGKKNHVCAGEGTSGPKQTKEGEEKRRRQVDVFHEREEKRRAE